MEKISGILPSSSRVSSVDLKESGPVRPGAPGFGRAEGVSTVRDAKIGETAGRAVKISQDQLDWRTKDMQNAATVRELSDRFFKGNQKSAEPMADRVSGGVIESEMNISPLASGRPSVETGLDLDAVAAAIEEPTAQPEGLHPRGSFVYVRA